MRQSLSKNRFLIFMLLLSLIFRLPSLFEPYWYGDEGIYLTVGLGIRRGLLLYKEIYDNKPPLIYLLAAFAGNLFWLRFILLVFSLGSVIFMDKVIRIFFAKNKLAGKLTLAFFTALLNLPLLEGNIANAEILQTLPTLAAIWLIFKTQKLNKGDCFFSGLLFSISILLKIPAAFDLAAVLIFLLLFTRYKNNSHFRKMLIIFGAGLTLPILATLTFFGHQYYLREFIQVIFTQNIGYLSSWTTGSHQISIQNSNLVLKGFILAVLIILLYLKRRRLSPKNIFFILWFGFSLIAASLSGRPYAHYLIQILPPISLIIGEIISNRKIFPTFTLGLAVTLISLLISINLTQKKFLTYQVFPYYQNFLEFILGKKNKEAYFSYFDVNTPTIYQVASFLTSSTDLNDRIFIWADKPQIFFLSGRLPLGRFTTAYHIISQNKLNETIFELQKGQPKIIIFDIKKTGLFGDLESFIGSRYSQSKEFGDLKIFRLVYRK